MQENTEHKILHLCVSAQNLENYWSEVDVTWHEYVR